MLEPGFSSCARSRAARTSHSSLVSASSSQLPRNCTRLYTMIPSAPVHLREAPMRLPVIMCLSALMSLAAYAQTPTAPDPAVSAADKSYVAQDWAQPNLNTPPSPAGSRKTLASGFVSESLRAPTSTTTSPSNLCRRLKLLALQKAFRSRLPITRSRLPTPAPATIRSLFSF